MALPDITRLAEIADNDLAGLKEHLVAIGVLPQRLEGIVSSASAVHPLLRQPILLHHARKIREPFAYAARALMFGDPIGAEERDQAFGRWCEVLLSAGWLEETGEGFVSSLRLTVIDGTYVLTDDLSHGGDAVMGLGPLTSPLCAASAPTQKIHQALDLGCGAGTFALLVSRFADKVIATDINERALEITRFNARLNSATNLETRLGSLFEPVAGERFDIVSSQPPFIPQPSAGKGGGFMEGGQRGDELMLELINGLVPHLTQRGRGVIISEWGHGPSMPAPPERVQKALDGAGADVLLFQYPSTSVDVHAIEYAAALHPGLGSAFQKEAMLRREHCAQMQIEVMAPTLSVIRRIDDRRPRFEVVPGNALAHANAKRIDELLLARDVVASLDSLLDAMLRFTPGVTLREEQEGPGANVTSTLSAVLPASAMNAPVSLTPGLLRLATSVHEARSVRAGIAQYVDQYRSKEDPNQLAKNVAQALLGGLLVAS